MFSSLRPRRDHDNEEGFTLIELMVVVLIIGILLAIAIPTFLGARDRANNRSAQSNLRNALTAEKTLYTDNQTFADTSVAADLTSLQNTEPSLNWANATPASTRDMQATVTGGTTVVLGAKSATGECWYIADISAPGAPSGTFYGSTSKANGGCPAALPAAPTAAPAAGSQSTGTTPTATTGWGLSFGK
ncbi:MAG: type II secretion system GspH family protein [Actinomycetota bacterium]|nr:type II secretion system GspH family protein [Actinomycetota bacterium]MDQ6948621.1 type II secretion system GspH family protein [Actinomycetota bacterium]